MTREKTPFTSDEIDEQIDLFAERQDVAPSSGQQPPDARLIHYLQALHQPDSAVASALERVRQRLEQASHSSVVRVSNNAAPERRRSALPERVARPPKPPRFFQSRARLATLVAVIALVTLVGGLSLGLVLVHHPGNRAGLGGSTTPSPTKPEGTSSPVASGPGVYLLSPTGDLFASSASTGIRRWHVQIPGNVSDMQLVGTSLFVLSDSGVYAINVSDGSVRWQAQPAGPLYNFLVADQHAVYGTARSANGGTSVYALNASDGSLLWQQSVAAGSGFLSVADGLVFVDTEAVYEGQTVFSPSVLSVLNASDGSLRWRSQRSGEIAQPPVVANGTVYLSERSPNQNGPVLYALSEQDGKPLWRSQPANKQYYLMPAVANGVVYTSSGATIFALSAQDGSQLWQANAGGDVETSNPAVAEGALFFSGTTTSSGNFVAALNASDGTLLWHMSLISPTQGASPPVVFNGVVYVWSDGMVYALSASDGTIRWKTEMGSAGLYVLAVG